MNKEFIILGANHEGNDDDKSLSLSSAFHEGDS